MIVNRIQTVLYLLRTITGPPNISAIFVVNGRKTITLKRARLYDRKFLKSSVQSQPWLASSGQSTPACRPILRFVSIGWIFCVRRLIKRLMDQMICRPAYVEHVQNFGSSAEESLPDGVEALVNLRNIAAVAFEHVVRVYPAELVCATFRPLLEARSAFSPTSGRRRGRLSWRWLRSRRAPRHRTQCATCLLYTSDAADE